MSEASLLHEFHTAVMLTLTLSLPSLIVASALGLIVGLLQAVTQIQDQTLPQVIKLIAVQLVVILMGSVLAGSLVRHAEQLFDEIPTIMR